MTNCPNRLKWVAVSVTTNPVTQVAETEVKPAVSGSVNDPSAEEIGRISNRVPKQIISKNPITRTKGADIFFVFFVFF